MTKQKDQYNSTLWTSTSFEQQVIPHRLECIRVLEYVMTSGLLQGNSGDPGVAGPIGNNGKQVIVLPMVHFCGIINKISDTQCIDLVDASLSAK